MKKKKYILPNPPKIDPNQPAWARALGLNAKQELEHHRNWRRQLAHQCGTDDLDIISAKVQRIKTVKCNRCGQACEAIAVGNSHHVTQNHVCEVMQPEKLHFSIGSGA